MRWQTKRSQILRETNRSRWNFLTPQHFHCPLIDSDSEINKPHHSERMSVTPLPRRLARVFDWRMLRRFTMAMMRPTNNKLLHKNKKRRAAKHERKLFHLTIINNQQQPTTMAMNAPPSIMQQHDPNDDPFADLAQETDLSAPKLASPMEFGMGLKNVKVADAKDDGGDEDKTEATHDETEHDHHDDEADAAAAATTTTEESGDKKEKEQQVEQ